MNHIVKIRISSREWDRIEATHDWDELPPTPDCKVPLIRLYKEVHAVGLREAKETIESVLHSPKYGVYTFLMDDSDLGRLYLFLRNDNHIATRSRDDLAGFEVLEILSNRNGGIIA